MKVKMQIDTKKFDKAVAKYVQQYERKEVGDALKEVAFALLGMVMPRTPVDTGRARAGWYPAARRLGMAAGGGGEGSIELKLSGSIQYIEISNRVHYIVYLEYGHSKQAPAGMLRISMHELERMLWKWKK